MSLIAKTAKNGEKSAISTRLLERNKGFVGIDGNFRFNDGIIERAMPIMEITGDGTKTVSYTHLDVYKRQVKWLAPEIIRFCWFLVIAARAISMLLRALTSTKTNVLPLVKIKSISPALVFSRHDIRR